MLDITLLRKDLASAVARLETRRKPQGFLDVAAFTALEAERKTIQSRTEELQSQRNQLSRQIGQRMSKGEAVEAVMAQVAGDPPVVSRSTTTKVTWDRGVPRSSNTLMKTNAAPATYPGSASGNTIRRNKRNPCAPRFSALSSIALSMFCNATERFSKMKGK